MAGRGFRGSDARVTFSTHGTGKVLSTAKVIDRTYKDLSRSIEQYSRRQGLISRLETQISNGEQAASTRRASISAKILAMRNAEAAALEKIRTHNIAIASLQERIHRTGAAASYAQAKIVRTIGIEVQKRDNLEQQHILNQRKRTSAAMAQQLSINKQREAAAKGLTNALGVPANDAAKMVNTVKKLEAAIIRVNTAAAPIRIGAAERAKLQTLSAQLEVLKDLQVKRTQLGHANITASKQESTALNAQNLKIQNLGQSHAKAADTAARKSKEYSDRISGHQRSITLLKDARATADASERRGLTERIAYHKLQMGHLQDKKAKVKELQDEELANTTKLLQGHRSLFSALRKHPEVLKAIAIHAAAAGAAFALWTTGQFLLGLAKFAMELERIEASFKALTGSAEAGRKVVKDMFLLSTQMPVDPLRLMEAARSLLATGTPAEDLKEDLRALGTLATALNQDISQLATIYGEIRNKNKVYREDVLQFSRRGIPLMEQLEKTFGKGRTELDKLVSEGAVKFEHFQFALREMVGEGGRFGDVVSEIMDTSAGKVISLENSWKSLKKAMGESLLASSFFETLITDLEIVTEALKEQARQWEKLADERRKATKENFDKNYGPGGANVKDNPELGKAIQDDPMLMSLKDRIAASEALGKEISKLKKAGDQLAASRFIAKLFTLGIPLGEVDRKGAQALHSLRGQADLLEKEFDEIAASIEEVDAAMERVARGETKWGQEINKDGSFTAEGKKKAEKPGLDDLEVVKRKRAIEQDIEGILSASLTLKEKSVKLEETVLSIYKDKAKEVRDSKIGEAEKAKMLLGLDKERLQVLGQLKVAAAKPYSDSLKEYQEELQVLLDTMAGGEDEAKFLAVLRKIREEATVSAQEARALRDAMMGAADAKADLEEDRQNEDFSKSVKSKLAEDKLAIKGVAEEIRKTLDATKGKGGFLNLKEAEDYIAILIAGSEEMRTNMDFSSQTFDSSSSLASAVQDALSSPQAEAVELSKQQLAAVRKLVTGNAQLETVLQNIHAEQKRKTGQTQVGP